MNRFDRWQRFQKQPKWVKTYTMGLAGSTYYTAHSENKKFGIIKCDGHTSYIDRGTGLKYCESNYILVEKGKDAWRNNNQYIWRGRLTKDGKQKLKEALERAKCFKTR